MLLKQYKSIAIESISIFFIALFVYTASAKLFDAQTFIRVLSKIQATQQAPHLFAYLIPAVELGIAGLLVFKKTRTKGLLLSCLAMFAFTLFVGTMLLAKTKLPCACGGVISSMGWRAHFYFNSGVTLLGLTATLLSLNSRGRNTSSNFYSNKTGVAENLRTSRHILNQVKQTK